jgi:hypothetical protein
VTRKYWNQAAVMLWNADSLIMTVRELILTTQYQNHGFTGLAFAFTVAGLTTNSV